MRKRGKGDVRYVFFIVLLQIIKKILKGKFEKHLYINIEVIDRISIYLKTE